MKILLVNDVPVTSGHGTEIHIRTLYEAFKEKGHAPFIITGQVRGEPFFSSEDTWCIPHFNAPPLRKKPFENFRNLRKAIATAQNIIQEIRPDIIHVHNMLNPFSLYTLRKLGPVVKSIHDCRPFCSKPPPNVASRLIGNSDRFCSRIFGIGCFPRCYMARSLKGLIESWSFFPHNFMALKEVLKCEKIVVYSRYLQQMALRKISTPERIESVYHFIDFEVIGSRAQTFPEVKRLLFVGRLSYEKGVIHLLESIKRIPINFETVIIGDGPLRGEMEKIGHTMREKNVHLTGYLPHKEILQKYKESTIVVFPSIGSEGCPLVGLEALANGKPVVGFDVGGVEEWLINGKTGFLVPRGDIEQMAHKIETLLRDEAAARRMGRGGMKLVESKFCKELHINRLLGVYEDAIRQRTEYGFQG